jgi:hypothetical protein
MSFGGVLAAIRPDEWNLALFVHVLGATLLVGGITTTASVQFLAWRRPDPADAVPLARLAFRALLFVAIPGWIVMRVGAQWIASEEGLDGDQVPSWVDIGYVTAEPGGALLLVATVLAGFGVRRLGRGAAASRLTRVSTVFVTVVLVGYLVAVWAMTAKPT